MIGTKNTSIIDEYYEEGKELHNSPFIPFNLQYFLFLIHST